ncbi:hypothetical protein [Sphingobium sp. YR768]|uniref:hypothetical protein n=1 Tax=Sphingobium sp. YR768 TaxID=1884365 RepID=UPI0008AEA213|nr:hypothetical protein [Sphingobium sp. YR768]SES10291.1 hypothetical protein SAMN05518866_1397 [Sphingobium sp. YR768]
MPQGLSASEWAYKLLLRTTALSFALALGSGRLVTVMDDFMPAPTAVNVVHPRASTAIAAGPPFE